MVEFFKALSDENRLRLVNILMHAELCVCEIEVMLELNQSNISRHLKKLKDAGIISSSKDAQWIHYKLSDDFEKENIMLNEYLRDKFEKNEVFIKDLERYMRYEKSNLNCQYIREDRDNVLDLIKPGGNS
jgi:ArsR family transcriptional regulator